MDNEFGDGSCFVEEMEGSVAERFCTGKKERRTNMEETKKEEAFSKNTIPLKVRCFVWRASMKRILVAGELAARGIMVQNQVCHLCRQDPETVDHLFTGCNYTKHIMSWIFKWCGMDTPHFDNITNYLDYAAS
ncbi:hypothetical protein LXL04_012532 [Taraxacum kok-saghyz]